MTVNVTSGGTDSAAEPILEKHGEVVAKALEDAGTWKAGNRNVRIDSEGRIDVDVMLWTHRRRTGASIVARR